MKTLVCTLEVLKLFGKKVIQQVFATTQVLTLRNMFGEGVSLTHEEWEILWPELVYSSKSFAAQLLEGGKDFKRNEIIDSDISDLVCRIMSIKPDPTQEPRIHAHPLKGSSRLCNKLLSFVTDQNDSIHSAVVKKACEFYDTITNMTLETYSKLIENVDLQTIADEIDEIIETLPKVRLNQLLVSPKPSWYPTEEEVKQKSTFEPSPYVDPTVLLQLIFKSDELHTLKGDMTYAPMIMKQELTDSQTEVAHHIGKIFTAEYILYNTKILYLFILY